MTATTARVRVAVRDLELHGDITPAGARVLANICDHEELMHIDDTEPEPSGDWKTQYPEFASWLGTVPSYDDIPTTAIPYDEGTER